MLFLFRFAGVVLLVPCGLLVVSAVVRILLWGVAFSPLVSVLAAILFFLEVNLLGLGILGEYLVRIYEEVKARPKYIVDRITGIEPSQPENGGPREDAQTRRNP